MRPEAFGPALADPQGAGVSPRGGRGCFEHPDRAVTVGPPSWIEATRDRKARRREGAVSEALVLLVLLWAVLLVPGALRSRNSSPHATVGGFERAMDVLRNEGRGTGRQLLVPGDAGRIVGREVDATVRSVRLRHEDPIVVQRRGWFLRGVAATGVAFLLALVVGGWMWLPFLLVTTVTGGYVALLRHLKIQRDEARRVVRELDLDRVRDELPQRAAVGGSAWDVGAGVRLRRWDD